MFNKFSYYQKISMISEEDITRLNETYNEIKLKKPDLCSHKNVTQLTESDISGLPYLESLQQRIKQSFSQIVGSSALRLAKLWLVSSNHLNSNPNTLPYITHFDKHRYLKAMVYLHDVTIEHGPIHLGRIKDDIDIETRRKALPKDYKQQGLNLISKDEIEGSVSPVLGRAGDAIFFDTNMPHKAGVVSQGFKREVLRFDYEHVSYNSTSIFNLKSYNNISHAVSWIKNHLSKTNKE